MGLEEDGRRKDKGKRLSQTRRRREGAVGLGGNNCKTSRQIINVQAPSSYCPSVISLGSFCLAFAIPHVLSLSESVHCNPIEMHVV